MDKFNYRDLIDKKFKEIELAPELSQDDIEFIGNHICLNCSNHPNNGGLGVCLCTLGGPQITC